MMMHSPQLKNTDNHIQLTCVKWFKCETSKQNISSHPDWILCFIEEPLVTRAIKKWSTHHILDCTYIGWSSWQRRQRPSWASPLMTRWPWPSSAAAMNNWRGRTDFSSMGRRSPRDERRFLLSFRIESEHLTTDIYNDRYNASSFIMKT